MEITGYFLLLVITFFYTNQVEAQGRGSVRLFNNGNTSPSNTAGIVEVYYSNQWGTICRSSYNGDTATVVCHQLGYSGGRESTANYGNIASQPAIYDVSCSTSYLVILQCGYNTNPTCSRTNVLAVQCYSTRIWDNPYSGMLRLQNVTFAGVGRAEVYCNGQWGAICDDSSFDDDAASTVCTQLGYNNAQSYSSGSDSGTVWLRQVSCVGTQNCLSYCTGGSCPTSSVTCTEGVAYVTCSYSANGGVGSTQYTCGISSGLAAAIIAGIVIACLVAFICFVLIITIPICICCCLGVGIGAAASSGGTRYTYSNI